VLSLSLIDGEIGGQSFLGLCRKEKRNTCGEMSLPIYCLVSVILLFRGLIALSNDDQEVVAPKTTPAERRVLPARWAPGVTFAARELEIQDKAKQGG
jgi:hypothetical protein